MKQHLRSILGFILSGVLLWWVLRDVSPAEVMRELRRADPLLLTIGVILATLIFPLRARRWRTILDPMYPKLPFGPLWRSTAIGMALNNLIPARAGEVARAYSLSKTTPVPLSTAFASLAVDRTFDAVVLMTLAFVAILSPGFPSGVSVTAITSAAALMVVGLLSLLYSLVFFPNAIIRIFEAAALRIAPRFNEKGKEILIAFTSGLAVLRRPGHFIAVFLWTLAHWLTNALGWWISMKAVGIEVPFSAALLLQTIVGFGVAFPAAPGFFGLFEGAAIAGLAIYGISKEAATTWAIGFHILSFLPITLIGAYYFSRANLRMKDMNKAAEDETETKPNAKTHTVRA